MISKDKKYRTCDGREVRIYATDGRKWAEVHGAILENNGWADCHWDSDGKHDHIAFNSLVEVKPRVKRTVWLNVYADKSGDYSQARSIADCMAGPNRIACVKVEIDCEAGEGL